VRVVILGLLGFILVGCNATRSALDPLERYQRLSTAFEHLSLLDRGVDLDARRLERSLEQMRTGAIVSMAQMSRRDAKRLHLLAAHLIGVISSVLHGERRSDVRAYLLVARASVQDQSLESGHIERAMSWIEVDPYLLASRDAQQFETEYDAAARDAARAVSFARTAALRERRIKRHLRFTPAGA
jgi:hypothetical protein